jgi:short-subunit dehydrogenase
MLPDTSAGVAVVTGATSGIGAALAAELAQRGYPLLLVARDELRLERRRAELGRSGATVGVRACDLTDSAARAGLFDELTCTKVSILCNNAGSGSFGTFATLDADVLHRQVLLDVLAVHDLCRAVLPGMVARGCGAVLMTGSLAGNQPVPGSATYAASKAFVNSLSEALSQELAGTGVTVSLLTPGPVRTDFARRAGVTEAAAHIPSPLCAAVG